MDWLYLAVCGTIVNLNYIGFNTVMRIYSPATYARVALLEPCNVIEKLPQR
jgi:hypothetical protein